MEMNNFEVIGLKKASDQANELQMLELSELQLAQVGGGGGDVVFA